MKNVQKILVIRFRRVGDAVISSVLCSSLKKTFPEAQVHYVLNEGIAPLFENHPDIDKLITFREDEMKPLNIYLKKVRTIMKENRYDLIVDTRSTIKTSWFCLFSLSTPYRLGKRKSYNLLHNYRIDIEGITDEVTKTLTLLQPLEKIFQIKYERNFHLYVTPEEKQKFSSYLQQKGINLNKLVILCTVAARKSKFNTQRMWDFERMKELLEKVLETYDVQLIFNYAGAYEEEIAYEIWERMGKPANVFIDVEAKGLRELMAMCANCSFFFGNEGGPRHISQALGVPSLAIFSPGTEKQEWLPNMSDQYQGIQPRDFSEYREDISYDEKFKLITVSAVWDKLEKMLERIIC